jgi:predicted RND superfamily exporter protein
VEDLPSELRARYVGRTGQYRLFVYPAADIWQFESLGRFARAVRSVDPDAHGTPVTIFEFLRQMTEGYQAGALYAVTGVVLITLLMFRAVRPTLLALIPLAVGAVWMLGLLGLLGVPLNAANLLFLPLIVGVGVHNGIHLVARFREIEKRGGAPAGLPRHTGRAISLVSLTTIVGFGSLMLSRQPGIYGVGLVVALGVGSVLVASLTVLPGLLALLARRTAARPPVPGFVGMQVAHVAGKGPVGQRVPVLATARSGSGHALSPTLAAAGRKEAA